MKKLKELTEGAPIVVAQAPIHIRNPKKAPQPYRNQGDIVPPTKPPSTEKRGVKGRPGQRPMPTYVKEDGGMVGGSPVNNVGDGNIAGLGVGPQGEPGVNKKKKKSVIPFKTFNRNPPRLA
jgi:hypothetical protein